MGVACCEPAQHYMTEGERPHRLTTAKRMQVIAEAAAERAAMYLNITTRNSRHDIADDDRGNYCRKCGKRPPKPRPLAIGLAG